MKCLARTQEEILTTKLKNICCINGNSPNINLHFNTNGYYILQITLKGYGNYITMSKKKKDKKKFEKFVKEAYKKGYVDLTEFVFLYVGAYTNEDEKFYILRMNKCNGYKTSE